MMDEKINNLTEAERRLIEKIKSSECINWIYIVFSVI